MKKSTIKNFINEIEKILFFFFFEKIKSKKSSFFEKDKIYQNSLNYQKKKNSKISKIQKMTNMFKKKTKKKYIYI